jgi:predicted RNA-binding Zn-ribbon protein involved in translation (DUF1610 family)
MMVIIVIFPPASKRELRSLKLQNLLDEGKALRHHGNCRLAFERPGDFPHTFRQPRKTCVIAQAGKLEIEHRHVEELGFQVRVCESRRQTGNLGQKRLSPWLRRPQYVDIPLDRAVPFWYKNKMGTKQTSRWKHDHPPSVQEFTARFPDDSACADWLAARRWPNGFVCPKCNHNKGWRLKRRSWMHECAKCGKQTSVAAGTFMHGSHLPLRTWFLAIYFFTTHSNGISALQLQSKAGIGSYESAWLLLHKLRDAMVNPDRTLLSGVVEVDETSIAYRTKDDPVCGGQGRSHDGKILIVGAVECTRDGFYRGDAQGFCRK